MKSSAGKQGQGERCCPNTSAHHTHGVNNGDHQSSEVDLTSRHYRKMRTRLYLPLVHDCWLGKCRCEQGWSNKSTHRKLLRSSATWTLTFHWWALSLQTRSPVYHGHRPAACCDASLVVSGAVDCGRRRRNVYDKKPQRYAKDNRTAHLTARSDKSVAYVTNNKRHEASRGLSATAELLVMS